MSAPRSFRVPGVELTDEPCPACELHHRVEISYRCAGCDCGVCAVCAVIVRETLQAWCPECHHAGES